VLVLEIGLGIKMVKLVLIIKPDGVERHLEQPILDLYAKVGWIAREMITGVCSREMAENHYEEHRNKPFFRELVDFTCSGVTTVVLLDNPFGTIEEALMLRREVRERYVIKGEPLCRNLLHCSDSLASAQRELDLWFSIGVPKE
jgi:nucleoside-diphosphate kinase